MPQTYTLLDFMRDYPDDATCLDEILEMRYGSEPVCESCETTYHRIKKRRGYASQWCGAHVFPCAETPFEKSRTPLQKWFYAMFLFTTTRHGVPAKELGRQLGVTYKTAWRMALIIRELMGNIGIEKLVGEVEIDESYIGGWRPMAGGGGRVVQNKTIVLGMKERGGNMVAMVIPDVKSATIQPLIEQYVSRDAIVHTDEWSGYRLLRPEVRDGVCVSLQLSEHAEPDVCGVASFAGIACLSSASNKVRSPSISESFGFNGLSCLDFIGVNLHNQLQVEVN